MLLSSANTKAAKAKNERKNTKKKLKAKLLATCCCNYTLHSRVYCIFNIVCWVLNSFSSLKTMYKSSLSCFCRVFKLRFVSFFCLGHLMPTLIIMLGLLVKSGVEGKTASLGPWKLHVFCFEVIILHARWVSTSRGEGRGREFGA